MMNWIKQLFSDDGNVSLMRVMCFIVCMTACYLALNKGPEELGVIMTLLGSAFGGKVSQKIVESKHE